MKTNYILIVLLVFLITLTNCKKDDIENPTSLMADTTTIDFGIIEKIGEIKTKKLTLSKLGDEVIYWHATTNKSWLQLNKASGEIYSKSDTIILTLNSSTLGFGDNNGEITITPSIKDVIGVPIKIKVTANINTRIIEGYILNKDEIWSGNILLKGDIEIPSGYTLTINPGTKIMVATNDLLYDGGLDENVVDFYVNGNLFIKGTSQEIVQFKSAEDIATNEDWWGIGLSSGSRLEMTYCSMSNSAYGLFIFSSTAIAPIIKNCLFTNLKSSIVDFSKIENTFTNNSFRYVSYGYNMWGSTRQVHINYSEFESNKYTDISIAGTQTNITSNAQLEINNSNFSMNQWTNINWSGNGYVKDSRISANYCFGIQNYPSSENGNTIVLQNQLTYPNQNIGCGFTSPVNKMSLMKYNDLDKGNIQEEHKKALELDNKNNAR